MRLKLVFLLIFVLGFAQVGSTEKIVIKGSSTVLPIVQKAAENYMRLFPDALFEISGGGSGNGIKALIDGITDIACSSRFIEQDEIALAVEKGVYPVPFAIAYDYIIPIIHPSNPVENLSLEQLRAIYLGQVTNWKEVGGKDMKILVVSRDTSSGTFEVWQDKVLDGKRMTPKALFVATNGAIAQAVAGSKFSIGYVGHGFVNDEVKPLSIDGVPGDPARVSRGEYPVSRPLYVFTKGWPTGVVDRFIRFLQDPKQGQKLVTETKFMPLY